MSWLDNPKVVRVTKFKREYRRCSMCPDTFKKTKIDWYPWPIDLDLCANCVRPLLDEDTTQIAGDGWVTIQVVEKLGSAPHVRIGMRERDWQRVFTTINPTRRLTL